MAISISFFNSIFPIEIQEKINRINTFNFNRNKEFKSQKNLFHKKLSLDICCGIMSGILLSPIITIIDKAVFQNASGKSKLGNSIKNSFISLYNNPKNIFIQIEYRYIFLIYFGTYSSSNLIDSFCSQKNIKADYLKFFGISFMNSFLVFLKDRAFVKFNGIIEPKRIPFKTMYFWGVRDSLTILCAFIIPNKIQNFLENKKKFPRQKAQNLSQIFCPIFLQFFSTPLHLLGLNYYNIEIKNFSLRKRLNFVRKEYFKSVGARMVSVLPAYGIGAIFNNSTRKYFFDLIERKNSKF